MGNTSFSSFRSNNTASGQPPVREAATTPTPTVGQQSEGSGQSCRAQVGRDFAAVRQVDGESESECGRAAAESAESLEKLVQDGDWWARQRDRVVEHQRTLPVRGAARAGPRRSLFRWLVRPRRRCSRRRTFCTACSSRTSAGRRATWSRSRTTWTT